MTAAAKAAGFGGETTPAAAMPNLLPNPGFTEVADGKPKGWTDLRTYGGARDGDVKLTSSPQGRDGTPFFAFLNYFDAHTPYKLEAPFDRRFSATIPRYWMLADWQRGYGADELQEFRDAYDSASM